MALNIEDVYELVDRAITFFSKDSWADKWKVQKGVFYFLWLYSVYKKLNFSEFAKILEIQPDKQGPYARAIEGEVECLIKDGYLQVRNPDQKTMEVKAILPKGNELIEHVENGEALILSQVKELIDKLDAYELVFSIYFNPYIPPNIREYFISNSEIKSTLIQRKDKYVKRLLEIGIIDSFMANKILESAK